MLRTRSFAIRCGPGCPICFHCRLMPRPTMRAFVLPPKPGKTQNEEMAKELHHRYLALKAMTLPASLRNPPEPRNGCSTCKRASSSSMWSGVRFHGRRWRRKTGGGTGGGCTKMRLASLRSEPVQRRNLRGSSPRSLSSHKMRSMSNLTTRMVVAMAAQSRRSMARSRRPIE